MIETEFLQEWINSSIAVARLEENLHLGTRLATYWQGRRDGLSSILNFLAEWEEEKNKEE